MHVYVYFNWNIFNISIIDLIFIINKIIDFIKKKENY